MRRIEAAFQHILARSMADIAYLLAANVPWATACLDERITLTELLSSALGTQTARDSSHILETPCPTFLSSLPRNGGYQIEFADGRAAQSGFKTQDEAIAQARKDGHSPLVARVRTLNDKDKPDHWRAA